jgi:PPK2 family polyphosphate:nucleotide phosphotransferase
MKSIRLEPGNKIKLKDFDPSSTGEFEGHKRAGLNAVKGLLQKLDSLQELLYAEHKHKVLIVLQGMDTSGKDGTIRRVFEGVNPQGVRVASFKVPSAVEMDHDFLWRIHQEAPGKGEMVIFNRSHYEDVLVVRVHHLVPSNVWRVRYEQINDFERMLSQEGTLILKFFLNVSLDEQKLRLRARLEQETKQWKYNPGDLQERTLWKEYMQAYEDALNETTTDYAPWYVVPSDHKWFRDWVVASTIVQALEALNMRYPRPDFDVATALRDFEKLA